MEEEIEYLRTELAKRSQELAPERERSDVLQREALGRIEALTAGEIVPQTVPEPPGSTETSDTVLQGSGHGSVVCGHHDPAHAPSPGGRPPGMAFRLMMMSLVISRLYAYAVRIDNPPLGCR